ncbi:MAG: hypothetical protein JXB47_17635 [Anaerolineae bacterium]|nr:hypothetical protein [Anaerolineae bacterium]
MAKKRRKGRQPNLPQEVLDRAQTQAVSSPRPQETPKAPAGSRVIIQEAAPPPQTVEINLAADYGYVMADLQRVGLLSVAILVALVVLRLLTG